MTDLARLAQEHKVSQVQNAAFTQAGVAAAFKSLDPLRLDETRSTYLRSALALVRMGHDSSIVMADDYYKNARKAAGFAPTVPKDAKRPTLSYIDTIQQLDAAGPVYIQQQMEAGRSAREAWEYANRNSSRTAKTLVLNGGRDRIAYATQADDHAQGWTRVTDGAPCHFCARLVSRGTVFKRESSARFRSHKGCGCGARPIFDGERGETDQERYYRDLLANTDPRDWRATVDALRDDKLRQIAEATLANGGATFDRNGNPITHGYAVAGIADAFRIPVDEWGTDGVKKLLAAYPDAQTLGTWIEEGEVWAEPSQVFATMRDAERTAYARNEIAYFDLNKGEEIRCTPQTAQKASEAAATRQSLARNAMEATQDRASHDAAAAQMQQAAQAATEKFVPYWTAANRDLDTYKKYLK